MPALDMLSRAMPRETRLLLPAGLGEGAGFDHRAIMQTLGFGELACVEAPAEIVWVEQLAFMDNASPAGIPADRLCQFRDRAMAGHGGDGGGAGGGGRRLYLQDGEAGSVAPGHAVEGILARQGFETIRLAELEFPDIMALFAEAGFVVASRGAALSNMLFAPPGLRVIELMDGVRFRPRSGVWPAGWVMCTASSAAAAMARVPAHGLCPTATRSAACSAAGGLAPLNFVAARV